MLFFITLTVFAGFSSRAFSDNAVCRDTLTPGVPDPEGSGDFQYCSIPNPQRYIAVSSRYLAYQNKRGQRPSESDYADYIQKKAALICKYEKLDDPYIYQVGEETPGTATENVKRHRIFKIRSTPATKKTSWHYEVNETRFGIQMEKIKDGANLTAKVSGAAATGLVALSVAVPVIAPGTGALAGLLGLVAGAAKAIAENMEAVGGVLKKILQKNIDSVNDSAQIMSKRARFIHRLGHVTAKPSPTPEDHVFDHWVFTELVCKKYRQNSFMRFLSYLHLVKKRPGQIQQVDEVAVSEVRRKPPFANSHHSHSHGHSKGHRRSQSAH